MFKFWTAVISAFLLAGAASASDLPCEVNLLAQPFFYKASKGSHRLYILGTIHEGVPAKDLPEPVLEALRSSDLMITEAGAPNLLTKIMSGYVGLKLMWRWSGPKLSEQLSPKAFELLKEEFERNGNSSNMIDLLSPTGAAFMSIRREKGAMDDELRTIARNSGLRHQPLESRRFQHQVLSRAFTVTAEKLEELLLKHHREKKDDSKEATLIEIYRAGDEAALVEYFQNAMNDYDFKIEISNDTRNQDWLAKLMKMKDRPHVFVAVGASHLYGDSGLLKLLTEAGYLVERQAP